MKTKIRQLNPNEVIFLYNLESDNKGPYITCNLLDDKYRYYKKYNIDHEDMQHYFSKLYLKKCKESIQTQMHNYRRKIDEAENEIFLKWRKNLKLTFFQKAKIFFKNLFRKDKKYYL